MTGSLDSINIISSFIDEETEIQRSEVPVPPGY